MLLRENSLERSIIQPTIMRKEVRKDYNIIYHNTRLLQLMLSGMVFDAAVQRWHSMQFCYGDHFKPTMGNFAKFCLLIVFPVTSFYQLCFGPSHKEYLKMVARGEVAYDSAARRQHWFNN